MNKFEKLKPERVFKYFEELTRIPRGSGNMEGISNYCKEYAKKNSLKAIRDDANNVIIYKEATKGYENNAPVILQGHLDMVCQKEPDCDIDFEKDGLDIYIDGDFIKAKGTTLGADNGIAVAMIMAILESKEYSHPPIEAVFTTDEEIGMIGAGKLSFDKLTGRKMINIDSEDPAVVTVSCAGGSDFTAELKLEREKIKGVKATLKVSGLKGGHSGVEINSNRINANILMARLLTSVEENIRIISINGGEKPNAIPSLSEAEILFETWDAIKSLKEYAQVVKTEIQASEPDFKLEVYDEEEGEFEVLDVKSSNTFLFYLMSSPNGVVEMSAEIENLVETSLNLGILKTIKNKAIFHFALRSNKQSGLEFLEKRLKLIFGYENCDIKTFGHYPPWEFKKDSELRELYKEKFFKKFGKYPSVEAIHAGLECGVFASNLPGLDCISIGPLMKEIHSPNERLSISSTCDVFEIILEILKK